jgi:hypothetical protein
MYSDDMLFCFGMTSLPEIGIIWSVFQLIVISGRSHGDVKPRFKYNFLAFLKLCVDHTDFRSMLKDESSIFKLESV